MMCSCSLAKGAGAEGVFAEQRADEGGVRQVRQHRPVPGDHEPAGVTAPDPALRHLPLEKADAPLEQRAQDRRQLLDEDGPAFERFPAGEADEVGAFDEEAERGAQHPFHLGPALASLGRRRVLEAGLVHEREPVVERVEQHGPVQRHLRREVMEQARRADADRVGDVGEAGARVPALGEALAGDGQEGVAGAHDDGHFRDNRSSAEFALSAFECQHG